MKTQCKSLLSFLGGIRGSIFASMLLFVCPVAAFAQGAEVCQGTGYTIADAVPASAGSEYRWLENGNVLANTNQAAYNVPGSKTTGVYTYVRQSKSADCPDWQSSNEFTVTVFACSFTAGTETGATATFTDPRDGQPYKTVVMPDGRTWFAQNLNYTKDLTLNQYAHEANGKQYTTVGNGVPAIGSYWCPGESRSMYSGDRNMCNIYGALYTWETVMMVDGKYADETKTSSAWDESWVSPYYYTEGAPATTPSADKNLGRGGMNVKGGGRGICPMGWHVPTVLEWAQMVDKVEGDGDGHGFSDIRTGWYGTDVAVKLRSSATYTGTDPKVGSWRHEDGIDNTDVWGFRIVPTGFREGNPTFSLVYQIRGLGEWAEFHSSCSLSLSRVYDHTLDYHRSGIYRTTILRDEGMSVRCIQD
jgi:uncharacterized protein (TIGR02145 family)